MSRPADAPLRTIRRSPFWWAVSKYGVLIFSKLWFRLRCEHAERLPAEGPVLLVANHASYLDPPMVGITASRWVAFLAQAGLAKLGPMRWWLAQVGVTLIDRDAPSTAALRVVADQLKAGEVVCVFPEGTRSRDGRVAPFKSGVEFLVRRTGATVLPIGIDGSYRAFSRSVRLPRPRKIVVRYGEAWTAAEVLAEGGIERLRRRVAELARCELADTPRAPEGESSRREGRMADPSSATSASASAGGGA